MRCLSSPKTSNRSPNLRSRFQFILAFFTALICAVASAQTWTPNAQELDIANRLKTTSGQHRAFLAFDPILSRVARERATDLAKRGYFDHINPDGHGANYLVRQAGYVLPSYYPADGNNIESIAGGQPDAASAWSDWMNSPEHKTHLLGELSFFAAQTSYGVGYYEDPAAPYRYYWVVITAPPMPASAALAILAPGEGASMPEGAVVISGTTSGSPSAASVQISVENAGGSSTWIAASGTASWSASLNNLAPGTNTLRVRSLAGDGTVLAQQSRAVFYSVMRPITVRVVGSGNVGKFDGTTLRELTHNYTITATPDADWLFAGWSGSWSGAQPVRTFTMEVGIDATATFIPNPFLPLRGLYSGLIGGVSDDHGSRGLLRLQLGGLGGFSGRVFFGGQSYVAAGQFDLSGKAVVALARDGTVPLKLKLTLDPAGKITGVVKDGTTFINLAATPARQTGDTIAAYAGTYSFTLAADPANTDPAVPHTDGSGTAVIGADGLATISGTLADGRPFSRAAWLAADGTLAFYSPLNSGAGSLTGMLTFTASPQTAVSGALRWHKPARAGEPAFDTTLGVR